MVPIWVVRSGPTGYIDDTTLRTIGDLSDGDIGVGDARVACQKVSTSTKSGIAHGLHGLTAGSSNQAEADSINSLAKITVSFRLVGVDFLALCDEFAVGYTARDGRKIRRLVGSICIGLLRLKQRVAEWS